MRTQTRNIYTASELQEHNPQGFQRALDTYREEFDGPAWAEETVESLKALFKHTGFKLGRYDLDSRGAWLEFHQGNHNPDVLELSGPRALAWLENRVLSSLRISWTGADRRRVARYGWPYRPGLVPPCPLTGYCVDDDLLDAVTKPLRDGDTVGEAFSDLASVVARILDDETNEALSEEYFLDNADANGWEYDEDGNRI